MRRSLLRLAAAITVAGACGIPAADSPEIARDGNVPFDLLDPAPTSTSTSAPPADPAGAVSLCLYQGETLVNVGRDLSGADVFDALQALEKRLSRDERNQGLETAITSPDTIKSASVAAGVARVDLASSFAALPAAEQLRVVAQVVCTATSRPGVGQVLFTLEGAPIDVPRGDGSLASGAVTRDDYARFVPRPA